jgi:hypothetical protein
MSRKRDDGDGPPKWGEQMRLRAEGERLIGAADAAIEARATELAVDPRRLRAFVDDARRRQASRRAKEPV